MTLMPTTTKGMPKLPKPVYGKVVEGIVPPWRRLPSPMPPPPKQRLVMQLTVKQHLPHPQQPQQLMKPPELPLMMKRRDVPPPPPPPAKRIDRGNRVTTDQPCTAGCGRLRESLACERCAVCCPKIPNALCRVHWDRPGRCQNDLIYCPNLSPVNAPCVFCRKCCPPPKCKAHSEPPKPPGNRTRGLRSTARYIEKHADQR